MNDEAACILVVDDDMFSAELTAMVLESAGYQYVIAEGGLDALEKMVQTPSFGAVVSDLNMPLIDGVQLFDTLRERGYAQPFILLSGQEPEALKAAHPGIDAVLQKDETFQETLPELLGALLAK